MLAWQGVHHPPCSVYHTHINVRRLIQCCFIAHTWPSPSILRNQKSMNSHSQGSTVTVFGAATVAAPKTAGMNSLGFDFDCSLISDRLTGLYSLGSVTVS